jgi:hypothetical protein
MDNHLKELNNEIYQKAGRNLVLFQRIEGLLRYLLSNSNISCYADELSNTINKQMQEISNFPNGTMGNLVKQYKNLNQTDKADLPISLNKAWISFNCNFEQDLEREEKLALLVIQRNRLAHCFLEDWNLGDIDNCNLAIEHLSTQHKKAKIEFEHLLAQAQLLQEAKIELAEFLKIEYLKHSRLVKLLIDISEQQSRHDGWTSLSKAEQLINKDLPKEIDILKKIYKCKTLKGLIEITELFYIYDETTDKGGTRTIYKLKLKYP